MNKGLEALNRVAEKYAKKVFNDKGKLVYWENTFGQDYAIIETELKKLEEIDRIVKTLKKVVQFNITMPTIDELENGYTLLQKVVLEQRRSLKNKERELLRNWILKECFPNELEVLRIIKEKNVIVSLLKDCSNVQEYNDSCHYCLKYAFRNYYPIDLTQAEFDLLKEYFK